MKRLDISTYAELRKGADVLEADSYGEKVLRLTNGNILKLFRRKRLLSSALWSPYAQRFCLNADRLRRFGFAAPKVIDVFRVREIGRDGVLYEPVPGKTLRQEFRENPVPDDLASTGEKLGRFVCDLFDRGVYFRSLHLGNIVRTPEGNFGLIDIADLRVFPLALPMRLRRRNILRMLRISEPGEDAWIDPDKMLCRNRD